MTRMPAVGAGGGFLPGQIDSAETFSESDLTVSLSNMWAANGRLYLGDGTTGDIPSDDSIVSSDTEAGVLINPNESVDVLTADMYPSSQWPSGSLSSVKIYRHSDGSQIASKSASKGDTVRFTGLGLSAGTNYRVVCYDYNDFLDWPTCTAPGYNITSGKGDVTDGVADSTGTLDGNAYCFDSIEFGRTPYSSGTGYIEWPYPADVYAWGSAFFEAVTDNETVDVYVEEYDGSSWNEVAGPIVNADEIPANPARNVRYRVEVSRSSLSNSPELLQIHRQEVLSDA